MSRIDLRVVAHGQEWPRLSETLPGPKDAFHCQCCGRDIHTILAGDLRDGFVIWQECDRTDSETNVFVSLCSTCDATRDEHGHEHVYKPRQKKSLVQRHLRLYVQLEKYYPWPGSFELCEHCIFRQGWNCTHEKLTRNGGPGLEIMRPDPRPFHGRFRGGKGRWYQGHGNPSSCEGQTLEVKL